MRRQWAAAEARAYGWGGIDAVSVATGMSPHTIRKGLRELESRAMRPWAPIPQRCVRQEQVVNNLRLLMVNWKTHWKGWLILRHAEPLSLHCAGHAKVLRGWQMN
jgi:hypothetical protein